jgi:hypothetical protein
MRKVSLGIVFYATVSVVLILGACMKPVGVSDLLNDDRTKEIIGGKDTKEGVKGGIGYEHHPEDLRPILSNGSVLVKDAVFRINSPSITITASPPAGITYSNIEWYCNGTDLHISGDTTYTINVGTSPFDGGGVYHLMVIGTADGIPYSTSIFIRVEP